jgi:hypothetical protein
MDERRNQSARQSSVPWTPACTDGMSQWLWVQHGGIGIILFVLFYDRLCPVIQMKSR